MVVKYSIEPTIGRSYTPSTTSISRVLRKGMVVGYEILGLEDKMDAVEDMVKEIPD